MASDMLHQQGSLCRFPPPHELSALNTAVAGPCLSLTASAQVQATGDQVCLVKAPWLCAPSHAGQTGDLQAARFNADPCDSRAFCRDEAP